MESQGLTTFALIFMLVSMGSVTALMAYCFLRILSPSLRRDADAGSEPGAAPPR